MPEKNKIATLYLEEVPAVSLMFLNTLFNARNHLSLAHDNDYPTRWFFFEATIKEWKAEGVTTIVLHNHLHYKYLPHLRRILKGRGFAVRLRRSDAGTKRRVTFKSRLKRILRSFKKGVLYGNRKNNY